MMVIYTYIYAVSEGVGGEPMVRRWSNCNATQNIFISSLNLEFNDK